ncbi:MFS transporter, OCT family, solute carrier family 22 (organic cation transporter), member 2 [Paragonimus westermani]|uniref:MFS transporter, OCT family, solute carrier family 22 (Organic cation transporter), member 2 n=1 Tax=Paragonimus westermani TaxID=34504 RepID=A0A5J4NZI4_9TREM|nr:MFS transporter, OCT family, solute carrier family 22 (organic cation transporter), member 2 [Paragonimus westermani]
MEDSIDAAGKRRSENLHYVSNINVDHLLRNYVGSCGLWQGITTLLIFLGNPSTPTFPVFANSVPMQRCRMDSRLEQLLNHRNLTFEQAAIVVGPWSSNHTIIGELYRGCRRYQRDWTSELMNDWIDELIAENFSLELPLPTESCHQGYVYRLSELQYPSSVVIEFETVCDHGWLVPMGTSVYMLGMMVGFIVGGWAGDRFGRKKTSLFMAVLEVVSTITTSLAPNYMVYIISRTVIGAANIAKLTVTNILMMEITLAHHRSCFTGLLAVGYNFVLRGAISLEAYYIPNWRWLNVFVMLPSLFCVLQLFFMVESPRWLVSQKRNVEALRALHFGYKLNHRAKSSHPGEMDPIAKLIDEELKKESCNIREQDMASTSVDEPTRLTCASLRGQLAVVVQPLSTPSLVRVTILGILVFTCQSMVYYGLLLYARAVRDSVYLVSFLNATTTIPAIALSSVLYRVVRHRRAPLIGVYAAALVALVIGGVYTTAVQTNNDIVLTVTSNVALTCFIGTMFMVYIYMPELYPSSMRAHGFGLMAGLGRLGSVVCTFVNQMDSTVKHGSPLLVYAAAAFSVIIILVFLPDTSGENLADFRNSHVESTIDRKSGRDQSDVDEATTL